MALLKWMHLRRLVPLSGLIQALERGDRLPGGRRRRAPRARGLRLSTPGRRLDGTAGASPRRVRGRSSRRQASGSSGHSRGCPGACTRPEAACGGCRARAGCGRPVRPAHRRRLVGAPAEGVAAAPAARRRQAPPGRGQPEAATARRDQEGQEGALQHRDRAGPAHRRGAGARELRLHARAEADARPGGGAAGLARGHGRSVSPVPPARSSPSRSKRRPSPPRRRPEDSAKDHLKQRAMSESAVQAMLDVFTAEIRDVEEIDT